MKDILDWLSTPIIDNSLIYINNWSIVHLINGFLLGYIFDFYFKTTYLNMFVIHTLWEVFEYYATLNIPSFQEKFINTFWDTICFMVGYFIYRQVIL